MRIVPKRSICGGVLKQWAWQLSRYCKETNMSSFVLAEQMQHATLSTMLLLCKQSGVICMSCIDTCSRNGSIFTFLAWLSATCANCGADIGAKNTCSQKCYKYSCMHKCLKLFGMEMRALKHSIAECTGVLCSARPATSPTVVMSRTKICMHV